MTTSMVRKAKKQVVRLIVRCKWLKSATSYTIRSRLIDKGVNRKVICITYPRSGHHLLVELLSKYFSRDTSFSHRALASYETFSAGEFHYCERYLHCNMLPCPLPLTNFQKDHDFGLRQLNTRLWNYIIQYRQPIETLISWYEAARDDYKKIDADKRAWEAFALKNIIFWKKFIAKWLILNKNPNTLRISYTDLIEDTYEVLKACISFLKPGRRIDTVLLQDCINKEIRKGSRRDIRRFIYYDTDFVKRLEDTVIAELRELKLRVYSQP